MKTTVFAGRVLLTAGIAGSSLVWSAAGVAQAADGNHHPLRGEFPTAAVSVAPAHSTGDSAGMLERRPTKVHESAAAGDWLRGDFPRAVAGRTEPRSTTQAAARVDTKLDAEAAALRLRAAEPLALTASLGPGVAKTDFICKLAQGELAAPAILRVFHVASE